MDVHANNWRYRGWRGEHLLVHLLLPVRFMRAHGLDAGGDARHSWRFFCQTRHNDGTPPTPYEPLWARFFSGTAVDGLPHVTEGLCLSLPIHFFRGACNPLDVTVVKIEDPDDGGDVRFLQFVNIALLYGQREGLARFNAIEEQRPRADRRHGCDPGKGGGGQRRDGATGPGGRDGRCGGGSTDGDSDSVPDDPLDAILASFREGKCAGPVGPGGDGARPGALAVLASLLGRDGGAGMLGTAVPRAPSVARHHQALENPGDVRCADGAEVGSPERPPADVSAPARIVCPVNVRTEDRRPCAIVPVTHVFSGQTYYVCFYAAFLQENSFNLVSALDHMTSAQLGTIDPLAALLSYARFLAERQNAFVDTLERACLSGGHRVYQHLPAVIVDAGPSAPDFLGENFVEACLCLRRQFSPTAAWVRTAADMRRRRRTMTGHARHWYADVIRLWESGSAKTGVAIPAPPGDSCDNENGAAPVDTLDPRFWLWLSERPELRAVWLNPFVAAVLVLPSALEALLILPGGFAIKGRYRLTAQDIDLVAAHYG
ncbi:viral DNA cleavage/packaging protein [Eptesicus fuscus gammaherpesvirus]|uniref:Viral DNA cleavage/packaging protein n=1 Tax=vespertilionid gammaherpesvirus 3 TaxID=2846598 RepID=A0A2D0ZXB4_9GAMA|nr:viral DNA cleavage/packaging protein [Eptesicus fuscus gammaherpesvirus]ATA58261.1 viral DNA cleavage/packaging protein [Eptesicus fuscus gammaherpesvirus]